MERKRFVDPLAVQYRSSGDAVQRERHVSKRKQRNRDLEIVFDPESHRYVNYHYYLGEITIQIPFQRLQKLGLELWHGQAFCS